MGLPALVGPPIPPIAEHAWRVFWDLSETRAVGMGGVSGISYTELAAYATMTGQPLTPLDVALVREADRAFLASVRKADAAREDGETGDETGDTATTEDPV